MLTLLALPVLAQDAMPLFAVMDVAGGEYNYGLAMDSSSNNNNGICQTTNILTESAGEWTAVYNGSTEYITSTNSQGYGTTADYTFMAWIKTSDGSSGFKTPVTLRTSGGKHPGSFRMNSAGTITADTWDGGGGGGSVTSGSGYNDNTWHHLAFVHRSDSTFDFWIDAVKIGTASETGGTTANNESIRLGVDLSLSRYFTGSMDNFAAYNATLSATQITNVHSAGVNAAYDTLPTTDLDLFYTMEPVTE